MQSAVKNLLLAIADYLEHTRWALDTLQALTSDSDDLTAVIATVRAEHRRHEQRLLTERAILTTLVATHDPGTGDHR